MGIIGDRVKADAETMTKLGFDVTYICVERHRHDFRLWNMYLEKAFDELLPLKREPIYL